jgi:hypothetical protein
VGGSLVKEGGAERRSFLFDKNFCGEVSVNLFFIFYLMFGE